MRFSAAHVVMLATASYVLATPAPADAAASKAPATKAVESKEKPNLKLTLDSERRLKSDLDSPYGSPARSPFGAYSPYGAMSPLSPYGAMSPLSPLSPLYKGTRAPARHFRKSSQDYCKRTKRGRSDRLLCSKDTSNAVLTKMLKNKSAANTKELSTMLDMARAFMEEHGTLTGLALRKHLRYRDAARKAASSKPSTPSTPSTPKSLKESLAAKAEPTKKVVRRDETSAGSGGSGGVSDGSRPTRRTRSRSRSRSRKNGCPIGRRGRRCRRKARKARLARLAAGGGGGQVSAAVMPQDPSAAAATPQPGTPQGATPQVASSPTPQQASRRSLDEEMMMEKRFFESELDELD